MSQIFVGSKRFGRASNRQAKVPMIQRFADTTWPTIPAGGLALFASMSLLFVAGCGSDDANAVVTPPERRQVEDESAGEERPGGMVMPPGEIPSDTSPQPPSTEGGMEMPENAEVPQGDGAASAKPAIEYRTWDEIQAFAKATGRVTVVDLWSLSCDPCLKEFPGLVRLHRDMGESVQCIAVDLDFDGRKTRPPEHYEEGVIAFLDSVGAVGFPTYISSTPSDDIFTSAELVSIPAVLVFGADGKMARKFVDAGDTLGFTYEKDVIPFVKKIAG